MVKPSSSAASPSALRAYEYRTEVHNSAGRGDQVAVDATF